MKRLPIPPEDAQVRLVKVIERIVHPDRASNIETFANQLRWAGKPIAGAQPSATLQRSRRKLRSMISFAEKLRRQLEDDPPDMGFAGRNTLRKLRNELPRLVEVAEEEEERLAAEAAENHGGIIERRKTGKALTIWSISLTAAEVYAKASGKRPTRSVMSNARTQEEREKGEFVQFLRHVFSALGIDPKKAPRAAKDILSDLRESPFLAPEAWPTDMDKLNKT